MTNREALILSLRIMGPDEADSLLALHESPWEDWATAESNVSYHVACPHPYGKDLPCSGLEYPWSTLTVCGPCKQAWLDEEAGE